MTPYDWETYSVVVMPFGYPNGGMENPQITFMSPSVIKAGTTDVAAHEIAHSWFGNLVTCGNWSHTWLNEGFTVFMEREIVKAYYGNEFYEESAYIGMEVLKKNLAETTQANGMNDPSDPKKLLCFSNRVSPEFCFTRVQYEKGFALVLKLETEMGEKSFFDFLHMYIASHKHRSLSVDDLIADFTFFVSVLPAFKL